MPPSLAFALPVVAALIAATPVAAQTPARGQGDPVRAKSLDSRQYRGEPKGNAASRNTRCRIVRRKGQDKRVCNTPTNYTRRTR